MRSFCNKVLGVRHDLKWVNDNRNRELDNRHRWRDRLMGGHCLQCVVDVDTACTATLCLERAGWTTPNRLGKRLRNP